ncbi:MAG: 5'/3'-nucleotidase SurE [Gammaproteobacteria bacterium]|nr:5'/3'-nucleotidase SurE [Gammaproteobacteria bacterium]
MHILLSNDDGYLAPGLGAMATALSETDTVTVVAPERDRSGSSNSLTLERPLRVHRAENGFYFVTGTPTDCVHLAITGLLDEEPDMVVSGINAGANMGDDVLYSGTVAAAMEGRFLGLPAIAVSMTSYDPHHYETGVKAIAGIIDRLRVEPLQQKSILNVNVPDVPWGEIKGYRITRLGNRHKSEGVIRQTDPRGDDMYWVGPPGAAQDAGEGTDFYAVEQKFISITPLQIDLTRYDSLHYLEDWLQGHS